MSSTSQTSRAFSLPAALIAFVVIYAVTLTYPLNIDSSVHAYMADLLLKGYWPYVSVWENNFPGTVLFVHLPELILFGKSAFAFHVWDMMWQLAGAFFLYRLVEREGGRMAAWLAVVFVAIYYLSLDNLYVGQRDGFATVSILAALWMLRSWSGTWQTVLAGVLCGMAVLIRPTNEIYVVGLAAILFLYEPRKLAVKQAVIFGFASQFWLVLFLAYYASQGWLNEFYTIAFRFNTEVYAHTLPWAEVLYPLPHYWLVLLGAIVGVVLWKSKERSAILILLSASIISLIPQKRYPYQYHTTFVLLLWLAAIGWRIIIDYVTNQAGEQVRSKISLGFSLVMVICFILFYTRGTTQKHIAVRVLTGHSAAGSARWSYDDSPQSGYQVLDSVASYIKLHTPSDGRVQMIGEYCYPLFQAGVLPATRFITFHSVMLRGASNQLTTFQQGWRKEILDSLTERRATYVIVADAPEYARGHLHGLLGHEILTQDFTELDSAMKRNYHLETAIGAFTLYRRN